jgi:hypothetical protein
VREDKHKITLGSISILTYEYGNTKLRLAIGLGMTNSKTKRLAAANSLDTSFQQLLSLQQQVGDFHKIQDKQQLTFDFKGDRQFVKVTP